MAAVHKIKKAILPVAGMGTRFLPASKAMPKEMLTLVDKPVIQYIVEEAIASGIEEIIMVTGRGKNAIEDHFDRSLELEHHLEKRGQKIELEKVRKISDLCDFWYVRQKEPLGLGHAILRGRDIIGNEPFAVLLGDDVMYSDREPVLMQLIETHLQTNASVIGVQEVAESEISKYGVIDPQTGDHPPKTVLVKGLVEKPAAEKAPSKLAILGRYILTPEVFYFLEKVEHDHKGEIQLTEGLNMLCKEAPVYAHDFYGIRYDTGDKLGFLKATVEHALRRPDLGDEFRQYLSSLRPPVDRRKPRNGQQ
ncbi:MAG: UTP--glucose-1-phosphate uridylyltransferase GalU [Candidatus Nitrosotenuis sp.]|nr:MAG: UTP--glucose-1-phosphate uridylyltransferase GalU [Candidatus Nitrosotenuis sp.]